METKPLWGEVVVTRGRTLPLSQVSAPCCHGKCRDGLRGPTTSRLYDGCGQATQASAPHLDYHCPDAAMRELRKHARRDVMEPGRRLSGKAALPCSLLSPRTKAL